MKNKDNLKLIKNYLPFSLRAIVDKLPDDTQEIRLRVNRPAALQTPFKTLYITDNISFTEQYSPLLPTVSQKELFETFNTICGYSVYSKQNEIINGFITLKGGNRAGICGTAVMAEGKIINIRDITSINMRLCCERTGCSESVLSRINNARDGVLLCGAPCSGKTTILRDSARCLSYKFKTALIDSRGELAAVYGGTPQNDVGLCDILSSYTKSDGFEQAVRCMSPELIICDEIGGKSDAASILYAQKSGVGVIAAAHCRDKNELFVKPYLLELVRTRCFGSIVFLGSGEKVGQVAQVYDIDELL